MLAKLLKNPLFEISESEGMTLAAALQDVMLLHSINISPSTLAYLKLIGALGMIYGPRIGIYQAAMAAQRKAQQSSTFDASTGQPVQ